MSTHFGPAPDVYRIGRDDGVMLSGYVRDVTDGSIRPDWAKYARDALHMSKSEADDVLRLLSKSQVGLYLQKVQFSR